MIIHFRTPKSEAAPNGVHLPRKVSKSRPANSASEGPTSSLVDIPDDEKSEHSQITSR